MEKNLEATTIRYQSACNSKHIIGELHNETKDD